jgi:hypothetical protein
MLALAFQPTLANTVSLQTGDLRQGSAFDRVKATFSQALKLGEMSSGTLSVEYDSGANRDFLKEAKYSGSLMEPKAAAPASRGKKATEASDLSVDYEVTHDFVSEKSDLKLTASSVVSGTKVGAELHGAELKEVSAERDIDVGDSALSASANWLVQAKTARVKLMSKLNGNPLSAQVDYNPDSQSANNVEVNYDHNLAEGRDLSASLKVDGGNLEVDYVDSKFEDGAVWTASASVPTSGDASGLLDNTKLSLKRAWQW